MRVRVVWSSTAGAISSSARCSLPGATSPNQRPSCSMAFPASRRATTSHTRFETPDGTR